MLGPNAQYLLLVTLSLEATSQRKTCQRKILK
jgi:hypothetical protein